MVEAIILFFSLVFLFIHETTAQNNCYTDYCNRSFTPVRFPFHLQGDGQSLSCGFAGFELRCSGLGDTVLRLPNSGDFIVRSIDYLNQNIVLYDPNTYCLPERLLKLNLTGSPFYRYVDSYNFFDCPNSNKTLFKIWSSDIVHCLSNATNTVVATTNNTYYAKHCQYKGSHLLPVSSRTRQSTASDLAIDFTLWWYAPYCGDCELKGGVCGFRNYTAQQIGCFYKSKPEPSISGRRGPNIFKLICFTIGVPVFICTMAVGCFLRFRKRGNGTQRPNTETTRHSNVTIVPQPPPVLPIGLKESTIQSFEKVVVGESRRMSGTNHIVCTICLSEYLPKNILRCIPECNHCFHADCIDKWLRMNRSCPICRNSSAHSGSR